MKRKKWRKVLEQKNICLSWPKNAMNEIIKESIDITFRENTGIDYIVLNSEQWNDLRKKEHKENEKY